MKITVAFMVACLAAMSGVAMAFPAVMPFPLCICKFNAKGTETGVYNVPKMEGKTCAEIGKLIGQSLGAMIPGGDLNCHDPEEK